MEIGDLKEQIDSIIDEYGSDIEIYNGSPPINTVSIEFFTTQYLGKIYVIVEIDE